MWIMYNKNDLTERLLNLQTNMQATSNSTVSVTVRVNVFGFLHLMKRLHKV